MLNIKLTSKLGECGEQVLLSGQLGHLLPLVQLGPDEAVPGLLAAWPMHPGGPGPHEPLAHGALDPMAHGAVGWDGEESL